MVHTNTRPVFTVCTCVCARVAVSSCVCTMFSLHVSACQAAQTISGLLSGMWQRVEGSSGHALMKPGPWLIGDTAAPGDETQAVSRLAGPEERTAVQGSSHHRIKPVVFIHVTRWKVETPWCFYHHSESPGLPGAGLKIALVPHCLCSRDFLSSYSLLLVKSFFLSLSLKDSTQIEGKKAFDLIRCVWFVSNLSCYCVFNKSFKYIKLKSEKHHQNRSRSDFFSSILFS